jgi:hypothetical protein
LCERPYTGCVASCVRDHILVAWRVVWETIVIANVPSARSPRRGGDHHRLRHSSSPVRARYNRRHCIYGESVQAAQFYFVTPIPRSLLPLSAGLTRSYLFGELYGELYALCKKALSFPLPDPGASLGIDAFTAGDQMGVGVCVNGAAPTGHPPYDRAALFGGVSHRGVPGFFRRRHGRGRPDRPGGLVRHQGATDGGLRGLT